MNAAFSHLLFSIKTNSDTCTVAAIIKYVFLSLLFSLHSFFVTFQHDGGCLSSHCVNHALNLIEYNQHKANSASSVQWLFSIIIEHDDNKEDEVEQSKVHHLLQ